MGWEDTVRSEAFPWSFHLPYPGYPGMVLALKQGWGELIRATPLRLWFTQFKGVTLVPIHWEDHGLGPASSQAPGDLTILSFTSVVL